jgi:hypothetical protein
MRLTSLGLFFISYIFLSAEAHAAPSTRGFQVSLHAISEDFLTELKEDWGVNSIRVQIGNNSEMDGKIGDAYNQMMEGQFLLLEEKLPLVEQAGLKLIFTMYSPPGGFLVRQGGSHYAMFSDVTLQDHFVQKWLEIIDRFGNHPAIEAFDLVNEPALSESRYIAGVPRWNELLLRTIDAIRAVAPDIKLVIKPMYGSPLSLPDLPPIDDLNIEYAYNAYYYNVYQHTGVGTAPFSLEPPEPDVAIARMRVILSPFYKKIYDEVEKGQIRKELFPPKLTVGEATVSACAKDGAEFLLGLLNGLEIDDSSSARNERSIILQDWSKAVKKAKRLKRKLPEKPTFGRKMFRGDMSHSAYWVHAYREAAIWDPTFECDTEGNLSPAIEETDRATIIKSFFSRNIFSESARILFKNKRESR